LQKSEFADSPDFATNVLPIFEKLQNPGNWKNAVRAEVKKDFANLVENSD